MVVRAGRGHPRTTGRPCPASPPPCCVRGSRERGSNLTPLCISLKPSGRCRRCEDPSPPPGVPTDTAALRSPAAMLFCPDPTVRRPPKVGPHRPGVGGGLVGGRRGKKESKFWGPQPRARHPGRGNVGFLRSALCSFGKVLSCCSAAASPRQRGTSRALKQIRAVLPAVGAAGCWDGTCAPHPVW